MTSESEEWANSKNGIGSPSIDDIGSGGSMGANGPLKKGPWTSGEDAILVEYVTKHGEGNWNAVQKHSGLARCGKSCRLRWANHLRPDLKKGAFSPEEERHIIELHAKMGNKWARMAAELPGRTDNEIKNYWNTRIKRRQRAGLPIYPPDVCLQTINEDQQNEQMDSFSSGDVHHPDFFQTNNFEIASVEFKTMNFGQQLYPPELIDIPANSLLEIPSSGMLLQGLNSSYSEKLLLSTIYPAKRLRGSESLFPGLNATVVNSSPETNQYPGEGQSFGLSPAYDPSSSTISSSAIHGSHATLNGKTSSSEPSWVMKLELPSLQNHMASWGSSSTPLPSLESVDTLMQTLPAENAQSCNLSPQNSGLLDAVLYESLSLKKSENNCYYQTSHTPIMSDNMIDLPETEWEPFVESFSPLCHSSSSIFSECTPISGSSFDELQSLETISVKDDRILMKNGVTTKTPSQQMIFSRPDFLLDSSLFLSKNDCPTDNYLLKDAMGSLHDLARIASK